MKNKNSTRNLKKKIMKNSWNFDDPCCLFKKNKLSARDESENIVNKRNIMDILTKNTHTCNENINLATKKIPRVFSKKI